tara:strand:+ start:39131 stop:40240 length:1110 start_codon:yes stop_codon:yes gene_type:complete
MNDTPLSGKQSPKLSVTDQWWRQENLEKRLPALAIRNDVSVALRDFFSKRDFIEVETAALQVSPGMEPHLSAFPTELFEPFEEKQQRTLYLHTSPEFAMKKLLCGGMERIFQLARVWRNGERSRTHHPEFTMLEWYRSEASWRATADDCEELVKHVVGMAQNSLGKSKFEWRGRKCDPMAKWQYLSVAEAFERYCDIDILATASNPLQPDDVLLEKEASRAGIRVSHDDRWDELFFRIFLEKIEPNLGIGAPTVLFDWPLSLAALARQNPDDHRVAERFEVFVCGVELANGFGELTDAVEQRRRFELDIARKKEISGTSYPIDEDFLVALASGMPDAAGIALGFDRLAMFCAGSEKIEDVLWAPVVTAC